jgi:Fe-S cluster biogenesis protein NfuA
MDLRSKVNHFIQENIAPSLALHGGAVEVLSLEKGCLKLEFLGSCGSCGVQSLTSDSIVDYLLENFDELDDVVIVNPLDD